MSFVHVSAFLKHNEIEEKLSECIANGSILDTFVSKIVCVYMCKESQTQNVFVTVDHSQKQLETLV